MKNLPRKTGRIYLPLLVMVFCTVGLLADRWYRDYEKALQAVKRGEWRQAVTLLEESLKKKERPQQKARTVGLEFIDYYPYYYLGLAYYNLGRYESAAEALEKSRLYAESTKMPALAREMETMLVICQEKIVGLAENKEQQVAQSKLQEIPSEQPEKKKEEKVVSDEAPQVGRNERIVASGKSEPPKTQAVPGGPQLAKPEPQPDSLSKIKQELLKEGRAFLKERDFNAAEQKFEALLQLDAASPEALAGLGRVKRARLVLRLSQGVRLYFEGDLHGAEKILQEITAEQAVATEVETRAHHFLALVFAERYLKENDDEGLLLGKVRRHMQQAAKLSPGTAFIPDPRFFSPKVINIIGELFADK